MFVERRIIAPARADAVILLSRNVMQTSTYLRL